MKGIAPGDRVDINLYVKRSEQIREEGTYTIMQAVRVFSVGVNTEKAVDTKGQVEAFRTVSVLVTPEQARHLIGAMEIGKVTLSLRHPNEPIDIKSGDVTPLPDILKANSLDNTEDIQPQKVAMSPAAAQGPSLLEQLSGVIGAVGRKVGQAPAATEPETGYKMHIYTNSEVKEYQWQDRNGMPQESTIFSTGTAGPSSAPAPAAAVGAGANNNRPGYLLERRPVWMTETPR
jgi:pilus assembly protein CpaB